MEEPKIGKAERVEENAGNNKRKGAAAEENGRINKRQRNERLKQDNASIPVKRSICQHHRQRSQCKKCGGEHLPAPSDKESV